VRGGPHEEDLRADPLGGEFAGADLQAVLPEPRGLDLGERANPWSFPAVAASPTQALSSETMRLSKFDHQPRFELPVRWRRSWDLPWSP
jgi:hypothetical protein